ncbi:MAG: type II secretion system protein GspG [Planctomycetota bacterium]|jgi:type II secretory pathway pseudopilin PulG
MKQHKKTRRNFTIIEMLAVMVIIFILIGLFTAAGGSVRLKARKAKTEAQIKAIEVALSSYYSDWGYYPVISEGALPSTVNYDTPNFWGSLKSSSGKYYIEYDSVFGRNNSGVVEIKDGFGNAYKFESPGNMNPEKFDIWSLGPDGADAGNDSLGEAADDIANWKRNF